MNNKEKPIGYWLRKSDESITRKVNEGLDKYDLTRFHWQVLNTVYKDESITRKTLLNLLSNFLTSSQLNEIVNDFTRKNLISSKEDSSTGEIYFQLTEKGKDAFTEIFSTQQKIRMQLFQGVTKEEYEATMKCLRKIVENSAD